MSDFEERNRLTERQNEVIVSFLLTLGYLYTRYGFRAVLICIGVILVIVAIILAYNQFIRPKILNYQKEQSKRNDRIAALKKAHIFLKPYTDIWRNLELNNRYCSISLQNDGISIKIIENEEPFREASIVKSNVNSFVDVWNMICVNFAYNSKYDGIIEFCQRCKMSIIESINKEKAFENAGKDSKIDYSANDLTLKTGPDFNIANNSKKIDINNVDIEEIAKLPCLSLIMAKKVIKKREEINGFKTFEEFSNFLKLNTSAKSQLKNLVEIRPLEKEQVQEHYNERKVDF